MTSVRKFKLAGIQLGPIQRATKKEDTVVRLDRLLNEAADKGASLAIFPECALTSFFPRWDLKLQEEIDSFFEKGDISKGICKPLFKTAQSRRIGFVLGYAEITDDNHHYNTCILVDNRGKIIQKYRKTHLPGFDDPIKGPEFQQLEKRYFDYGTEGYVAAKSDPEWIDTTIGMLICNDRRWPEAWRCYALQGMELCISGYNTPCRDSTYGMAENKTLRLYQSELATKGNAYMNCCFAVSVAKCGVEDGQQLIGGSLIVAPDGTVIALAKTEDDEILLGDIDLDKVIYGRSKMFDFGRHRRPELYKRIVKQKGIILPLT
ncbi:uncharacterized protein PRCAT00000112001 [Priceomyces carsonii]|uniref:uncharacterized protein n=1 Tax=Priceomyces carsonii TaxID=28549 RepID=UPI002EDA43A2|nr:unnamed protein product [Priceomyces carsonii]